MKLVRVRWFNWGQHHDDQGEVHSHRIRYCRSYPVGHRTAGKCDRRFLPWFRIDGQFSAHSNWRVRARARAPNNHSLEAWAPPLGASCIGYFSSRCFKQTPIVPNSPWATPLHSCRSCARRRVRRSRITLGLSCSVTGNNWSRSRSPGSNNGARRCSPRPFGPWQGHGAITR